ncbi:DNA protecting protein DprA [Salinisphaera sp. PC39]|uniref:DNA-processing protein DprA n=1 Tax=Salinisphaera sp. PC39 TaxID=1304156 RepID=UPI00333E42ED
MPSDTDAWLTLARAPGLGATLAGRLLDRYGDAGAVLAAGPAAWREAGVPAAAREAMAHPDEAALARDRSWLERPDADLITRDDPRYPAALRDSAQPPPWLFALGDTDLLAVPGFAIVGSRNPTPAGLAHARDFGAAMARAGFAVVSGLAAGIDTAAHEGALEADGMTIAVCGTGLDRVYPARNRDLARRIAARGLLVSEFVPGTEPRPGHFPRRNRVIAGLCVGTLVVEAARTSGSLITARLALEAGREVFALPGAVDNPLARGCHRLIREGAKLVESSADILEEIAPQLAPAPENPPRRAAETDTGTAPDDDYRRLLDALRGGPATVDTVVERTGLTAEAVSSMLLIMELRGLVAPTSEGAFQRTGDARAAGASDDS